MDKFERYILEALLHILQETFNIIDEGNDKTDSQNIKRTSKQWIIYYKINLNREI